MKKSNLFPIMNNQEKRINQVHGLSNVLIFAGGLPNHSQKDLCNCLSIVSDLTEEMLRNQKAISEGVTGLSIVSDCVNGN
jgi:hypothetical protein